MQPVIVSLGTLPVTHELRSLAAEFGFSFVWIPTLAQLQTFAGDQDVCAVLFEPRHIAPSWREAIRIVQTAAPHALPVTCHRFCDAPPWPELADAGVFHALWVPFDLAEVRQSWGFVQEAYARRRRAAAGAESNSKVQAA